ncbi:hypothetical protein SPHINGO391_490282 [Sphingomonas aurantiaca]|uniref:Uncharacterized protein n=1 Tax=Sphingomonas aurantiaca TaxID=185949 RepID=A0A5E8A6Y9_9SPHN|nr:hypothetical protein SPHINGO391_490282 [Sphingomonas aurantiaca]
MHAGAIASAGEAGNWFFCVGKKEEWVRAEARRTRRCCACRAATFTSEAAEQEVGLPTDGLHATPPRPPRLRANKSSLRRPRG